MLMLMAVQAFLSIGAAGSPAAFRVLEDGLELTANQAAIVLDRRNGRLVQVRLAQAVLAAGGPSLWTLRLQDGRTIKAESFQPDHAAARFAFGWDGAKALLSLHYTCRDAEVRIEIQPRQQGFAFTPTISPTDSPGLEFGMIPELVFPADRVREFSFPVGAGMALLRSFFERQPADADAATVWRRVELFDRPLRALLGSAPAMRPWLDDYVAVRLTSQGRRWLGDVSVPEQAVAMVRRPPQDRAHIALLSSQHGTYLAAYPLGRGWFVRFGGQVDLDRQSWLARIMTRLLRHVLRGKGSARVAEIAFLTTLPGRQPWAERIDAAAGASWEKLTSFAALQRALGDPNAWPVVLNPYPEVLPSPALERWQDVLAAIRSYCRAGGVWIDAGGDYTFFRAAVPDQALRIDVKYPGPNWQRGRFFGNTYADFVHLDSEDGLLAVYRIQPDQPDIEPYTDAATPQKLFVPSRMSIVGGQERGGRVVGVFERSWQIYAPKGRGWTLPALVISPGRDLPQAVREYLAANRLTRRLEDKVDARLLERWKRTVLLKYVAGGNRPDRFEYFMKRLALLPGPMTLHPVNDWLYMGFDESYPDNLLYDEKTKTFRPNPAFCAPEQWRRFYVAAQARGHLVMPYANNTWWCDDPRPPTFAREGEAPLLRTLDGALRPERYGRRTGFSICPWHPVVRRVNRRQFQGLTEFFPGRLVFYDQLGARDCPYDTNPASPHPTAYTAGWINLAREHSRKAPISTEQGCDRFHNTVAQFCGSLGDALGSRYPRWAPTFGPGRVRVSPVVLLMGHDKVIFTSHDLGTRVGTPRQLSWFVLTGQQLIDGINVLPDRAWTKQGLRWLRWLSLVQRNVLAEMIGRPLTAFRYLADDVHIRRHPRRGQLQRPGVPAP